MTTPKFTGTVQSGKIEFYGNQKEYLANWIQTLEGERVVLQVKKWRPQRTLPQNAYLHAVVFKTLADYTGYTLEEIKDAMKEKFASKRDDMGLLIIEQTSKMNTKRMADFIEDICRFAAAELNIYIPPPNE